jgi:hypothetical protein
MFFLVKIFLIQPSKRKKNYPTSNKYPGGPWGMLPRKIWSFRSPEWPFPAFSE